MPPINVCTRVQLLFVYIPWLHFWMALRIFPPFHRHPSFFFSVLEGEKIREFALLVTSELLASISETPLSSSRFRGDNCTKLIAMTSIVSNRSFIIWRSSVNVQRLGHFWKANVLVVSGRSPFFSLEQPRCDPWCKFMAIPWSWNKRGGFYAIFVASQH